MKQTFPKSERLTHKKHIDMLFDKKRTENIAKTCYPFRLIFCTKTMEGGINPKVLISVSKRNFKKAVDRNLLKRRTREAYRINKGLIKDKKVEHLALIYIGKEIEQYETIEKGVLKAFNFITAFENQQS